LRELHVQLAISHQSVSQSIRTGQC